MLQAMSIAIVVAFATLGTNGPQLVRGDGWETTKPIVNPSPHLRSPIVVATAEDQVAALLRRASDAGAAGRLVTPAGSNALEFYLLVLEVEPENYEARARIRQLRPEAARAAAIAAARGDIHEEQRLRNLVVRVDASEARMAAPEGLSRYGAPPSRYSPAPEMIQRRPPVGNIPPSRSIEPDTVVPHPRASQAEPTGDLVAVLGASAGAGNTQSAINQAADNEKPRVAVAPTPPISHETLAPNEVDRILQRLPWGQIAFNTPQTMTLGREETIHAALSGIATANDLKKMITETGPIETDRIQISEDLHVYLTGPAFDIAPVEPEKTGVGYTRTTEWRWHVTPKESGAQHLDLTVNVIVKIDGEDREVTIKTFEKDIEVDVNLGNAILEFVSRNWQWLWATLLVPLAAWLWRYFVQVKKLKRKNLADRRPRGKQKAAPASGVTSNK